jgi:O-antigen/teichoic acid export membrane protein
MTNTKVVLAAGLSAATLALVLTNVLGGPRLLQSAGLAAAVVISAIALAAGAFALSRRHRSFLVAGLLALSGIILMIPAIIATGYLTVIVFPGPILGVIFGLVIFGLGLAKGISSVRATEMPAR